MSPRPVRGMRSRVSPGPQAPAVHVASGANVTGRLRTTAANKKPRRSLEPGVLVYGLAVTYFRVRKRHTIIGANPFHDPVRDGKAWFQAAVAARQKTE